MFGFLGCYHLAFGGKNLRAFEPDDVGSINLNEKWGKWPGARLLPLKFYLHVDTIYALLSPIYRSCRIWFRGLKTNEIAHQVH